MITVKVVPDAGEAYELTCTSRDVLNWEKTSKGTTFNQLMDDLAMVHMYRIAHLAAKRQQMFTGTLDEFEKTVELELVGDESGDSDDDEDGADPPTGPGRSTGG